MPFRTPVLALAAAGLFAAAAQAQTTSPANTASSNGKDASTVSSTPPQDPTLGSGQTGAGAPSAKATHHHRMHHRSASGGAASSTAPGGPGSPPPTLPNTTAGNDPGA